MPTGIWVIAEQKEGKLKKVTLELLSKAKEMSGGEEVAALLKATLDGETRRIRTTLGFAKEHTSGRELTPTFDDLDAWKKTRVYQ